MLLPAARVLIEYVMAGVSLYDPGICGCRNDRSGRPLLAPVCF
jgi:hypothetical protein